LAHDQRRQIRSGAEGVSPYLIEHLSRVAEAHQLGEFEAVTDVIETIGGAPPKSLEAFIRENATVFGVPQDAVSGLSGRGSLTRR
jgi:NAD(P)H dehydrogenase (quinone)